MSEPVPRGLKTWREFWPYYVREHLNPVSRALHVCGTALSLILLGVFVSQEQWAALWIVPLCGYAFAWIGHFVFEKNRPATFRYPFFSLASDFVMLFKTLTFQMGKEIAQARAAAPQDGKRDEI
ncbi:MAG: DUF962 domain-containing protein [Bdellovibrionales bacterium]|nr:DUF962 domain-containing protein [Bdellovibrionales bacterium]